MEIAFTIDSSTSVGQDVICVVQFEAAPRKGDVVEINENLHVVEEVEWHISTDPVDPIDPDGWIIGKVTDTIVRLKKTGEV